VKEKTGQDDVGKETAKKNIHGFIGHERAK